MEVWTSQQPAKFSSEISAKSTEWAKLAKIAFVIPGFALQDSIITAPWGEQGDKTDAHGKLRRDTAHF